MCQMIIPPRILLHGRTEAIPGQGRVPQWTVAWCAGSAGLAEPRSSALSGNVRVDVGTRKAVGAPLGGGPAQRTQSKKIFVYVQ